MVEGIRRMGSSDDELALRFGTLTRTCTGVALVLDQICR